MATNTSKSNLSTHSVQWEWEGDRGTWQQYAGDLQDEITQAFDVGNAEITLEQTAEVRLTIQFDTMIQLHKESQVARRVRLTMALPDKNGFFAYEYQNENKKWSICNAKTMLRIANGLATEQSLVSIDDRASEIDLDELTERNLTTNVTRKIRCIKSVARLPLSVSGASNKRLLQLDSDDDDTKKKKRPVSKSTPIEKSSMRTVTTAIGKVPVDGECVTLQGKAHVHCEDKDVFDCMLNQTNVGMNNNKFYLIQLLEENQSKKYYVWLRWGRVGYNGQNNLLNYGSDLDDAKRFFCQKFSDKTRNDFYFRHTFTKYPGKYDYVQLDYNPSRDENNQTQLANVEQIQQLPLPESKLDRRVQNLIQLICNVQAMEEALLEMKFDARKNPLGKLSAMQIKAGYSALQEIETFIKSNRFNSAFIEANNTYYSRIPHEFRRSTPPLIKTIQQLKSEIELLEALDEIEVVFSSLQVSGNARLNPIDQHYERLQCQLCPMEKTDAMYQLIERYLQSTHASTHQQYSMEIDDVFQIERENEKVSFRDVGNRMLLWHGSRLTNYAGILTQGLRIAPPEAPVTGYMFGKGLYFADMSSKSANYCYATPSKNTGLVLLSEVALGKPNELLQADNHANKLPKGLSSVIGLGSVGPSMKNAVTLDDGVVMPMGPGEQTDVLNPKGYTLNYNEYIVYDTNQVRMRYLVKVKFAFH